MRGAVVMAYGSPASPDQVEEYYTHIRRGRPPSPDELADLMRRYAAIGGISPLARHTADQIAAIRDGLGEGWMVVAGNKHAAPFIEDGVAALIEAGVESITGVVLAPHFSAGSVGQYLDRAAQTAGDVPFRGVEYWYDLDQALAHTAASLTDRLQNAQGSVRVVFTAHSLPERVLVGDPYPDQLTAGAAAIAERVGLSPAQWQIGWQSAGRTADPWRGPDILQIIEDLAADGVESVIVVPHGFTSEHLEVLYDLDIDAAARCQVLGIQFARTDVIGADPTVMAAVATRVAATAPVRP